MLDGDIKPDDAAQRARVLAAEGRYREAVALGREINRAAPNPAFERDLRDWRHAAFYQSGAASEAAPEWPQHFEDPRPNLVDEIPEIEANELTPHILGGAILHHGSLIVRGLLSPDLVLEMLAGVNNAYAAREGPANLEQAWYAPFETPRDPDLPLGRSFAGDTSMLTADSPRMLARWLDILEERSVLDAVTAYLGERPVLSAHKTRMYRVPAQPGGEWHQDGAFLGGERTRVMNLWVALSDCGEDAPGLEIVPWRLNEIVPPGTHESHFQWSVGHGKVAELANGRALSSPAFKAGDAMLFDHLCLHRTGVKPGMTRGRHALETWMFAPSTYPDTSPLII